MQFTEYFNENLSLEVIVSRRWEYCSEDIVLCIRLKLGKLHSHATVTKKERRS
jgi:hypothetical protein